MDRKLGILALVALCVGGGLVAYANFMVASMEEVTSQVESFQVRRASALTKEEAADIGIDASEEMGLLVGRYYPYSDPSWKEEYGKDIVCSGFEVTSGDSTLIEKYTNYIKRGNTVNRLSSGGRLVINLPWSSYSTASQTKIKAATLDNPISLRFIEKEVMPQDAGPCFSFFEAK